MILFTPTMDAPMNTSQERSKNISPKREAWWYGTKNLRKELILKSENDYPTIGNLWSRQMRALLILWFPFQEKRLCMTILNSKEALQLNMCFPRLFPTCHTKKCTFKKEGPHRIHGIVSFRKNIQRRTGN